MIGEPSDSGVPHMRYVCAAPGRVSITARARGFALEEVRQVAATRKERLDAEDVALELVATKMALMQVIWSVSGHTAEPDGLAEWVHRSPVDLPLSTEYPDLELYERDFDERLNRRADEIESEMMEAVGHWLLGTIRDRRDARGLRDA
jgi:hypothetical protein